MARSASPRNILLRSLSRQEFDQVGKHLELVELGLHAEIHARGREIDTVFFPETAMISLVTRMEDGTTIEMGVVGRFGMAGFSVLLGSKRAPSDAFVQIAGTAYRMPLAAFRKIASPGSQLHSRLLLYTQSFLLQTGQAAACNALHTLQQRCARWLLTVADQIGTDSFQLTHEFLAQMLGVRRAGVTSAQGNLRANGLIATARGRVSIKDRRGLEQAACECFGVIHRETERIGTLS